MGARKGNGWWLGLNQMGVPAGPRVMGGLGQGRGRTHKAHVPALHLLGQGSGGGAAKAAVLHALSLAAALGVCLARRQLAVQLRQLLIRGDP